jgi:lipoate-protein ligase A
MKAPIRTLDTGLKPARWNVAMTAALVERHGSQMTPDVIRFHRYPACVLVGRSQRLEEAADLDYCRREGIELARRVTGGGAVFMSPRMLAWDVIIDRGPAGANLATVSRRICEGVAAGLSRLGAPASYRPPGEIEIDGRKVSGSAGYVEGRAAVLQGTVLIADDMSIMAAALRIPETLLRRRVTCLAAIQGATPAMTAVAEAVLHGLTEALDRSAAQDRPTAPELARTAALLEQEIGTEAFVTGAAAAPAAGGAA